MDKKAQKNRGGVFKLQLCFKKRKLGLKNAMGANSEGVVFAQEQEGYESKIHAKSVRTKLLLNCNLEFNI